MICMHCYVSGRVQGVFFRASARHEAEQLGITGYARNSADGRLEVLVCGPKEQVDRFCAWLSHGPDNADVSNVSCQPIDTIPPRDFSVG
ncbi:MAG: acylphosphatase [Gammaproteobacteria bacterium]